MNHFREAALAQISLTTASEPPVLVSSTPLAVITAKVGMAWTLYLTATSEALSTLTLARAMPVSWVFLWTQGAILLQGPHHLNQTTIYSAQKSTTTTLCCTMKSPKAPREVISSSAICSLINFNSSKPTRIYRCYLAKIRHEFYQVRSLQFYAPGHQF